MPVPDGVVDSRMIGRGTIHSAHIVSLTADKITAGSIGVSQYIGSPDYVAGVSGWRINGDGTFECASGTFRGEVNATSGTIEDLTITGQLTSGDTGPRMTIRGGTTKVLAMSTGHANETDTGYVYANIRDHTGSDYLETTLSSPSLSASLGDTYMNLSTESEDDSSSAPKVEFGYTGDSTQTPVFLLGNAFEVKATGVYNKTTGVATNMVIQSDGYLYRSTSAAKYKRNITDASHLADTYLRPVRYQSTLDDSYRYGLIADDVAEAIPEAAEYGDDGIENYDTRAVLAALVAKVNRLEKRECVC